MNWGLVVPEVVLMGLAFAVLGADLLIPPERKHLLGPVAAVCLVAVAVIAAGQTGLGLLYGGVYRVDLYTIFFRLFFSLTSFVVVLLSLGYVRLRLRYPGEYYGILLLATLAMVLMTGAGELITAYISLETLNFCLYTLASYDRSDPKSNEAGLKYIILSILASALLLYGMAYMYGVTGSTSYEGIASALAIQGATPAAVAGIVLITAGMGFKVAAVPFHMWTPDVYEGAPTPVTAFISVGSKAAGFALLLRLFGGPFLPIADTWQPIIVLLSAVTMTLGNLVAIQQTNIKRLLAYSSIGQVGYLLMGAAALSQFSASGIVFHMLGYAATNLAAFLAVIVYENFTGKDGIDDYAGLAPRAPLVALVLAVALFSLAGMPLFAGFTTKFYLFTAVAEQGYLWLVALAAVNSLISLYYYIKVIRRMYIDRAEGISPLRVPLSATGTLAVLLVLVIGIGVYPAPWVAVIDAAVSSLQLPM